MGSAQQGVKVASNPLDIAAPIVYHLADMGVAIDKRKRPKFGRALRSARKQRGWTAATLGGMTGLSRLTIVNVETGKTAPSFDTVTALARVFGQQVVAEWLPKVAEARKQEAIA